LLMTEASKNEWMRDTLIKATVANTVHLKLPPPSAFSLSPLPILPRRVHVLISTTFTHIQCPPQLGLPGTAGTSWAPVIDVLRRSIVTKKSKTKRRKRG
jgi:hypothetical protein